MVAIFLAVASAAEENMDGMKSKRGLALGYGGYSGYHAPIVAHHSYASSPIIHHSAPIIAAPVYHAPVHKAYTSLHYSHPVAAVHHPVAYSNAPIVHHSPYVHHAPIVHHAPLAAYHHAPIAAYHHGPVYSAFHKK